MAAGTCRDLDFVSPRIGTTARTITDASNARRSHLTQVIPGAVALAACSPSFRRSHLEHRRRVPGQEVPGTTFMSPDRAVPKLHHLRLFVDGDAQGQLPYEHYRVAAPMFLLPPWSDVIDLHRTFLHPGEIGRLGLDPAVRVDVHEVIGDQRFELQRIPRAHGVPSTRLQRHDLRRGTPRWRGVPFRFHLRIVRPGERRISLRVRPLPIVVSRTSSLAMRLGGSAGSWTQGAVAASRNHPSLEHNQGHNQGR